ncbi:MAG: molybdopterin-dependent oxidoreductase [Candidatus Humimicrobiaceae bacterium]
MKKFIALFIALLMLGAILVGCKSNIAKSETATAIITVTTAASTDTKATSTTVAASAETSPTKTAETTTSMPDNTTTQSTEAAATNWTIIISGINSKDINFTAADAAKMATVELTVDNKKSDGTVVVQKWTGIPLKSILDFYGANDYDGVKVETSDGSLADLDMTAVADSGTILGLKLDDQALSNADGLQLIVKSKPSKLWVKAITKITLKG